MNGYRIVEGLPKAVEMEIVQLRANGWKLNGPLAYRNVDGNTVAIQGMIEDNEDTDVEDVEDVEKQLKSRSLYVFKLMTSQEFDTKGLINSRQAYRTMTQGVGFQRGLHTTYVIKLIATSTDDAKSQLVRELEIQHPQNADVINDIKYMYTELEYL